MVPLEPYCMLQHVAKEACHHFVKVETCSELTYISEVLVLFVICWR